MIRAASDCLNVQRKLDRPFVVVVEIEIRLRVDKYSRVVKRGSSMRDRSCVQAGVDGDKKHTARRRRDAGERVVGVES